MQSDKISEKLRDALSHRPYILCICEGSAEAVIINRLLSENLLRFTSGDLVNGSITRTRKARDVEKKYLNRDYEERGLVIFRILDSRSEQFSLKKQYAQQYRVFNFYTRPEIEILHIIACGKYDDFEKSKDKASDFFKGMGWRNIKSQKFVEDFYSDTSRLVTSILEYNHRRSQKGELNLSDLLAPEAVARWNARK